MFNTTIEQKKKHWKMFSGLIEKQFIYGAEKYAFSPEKESTDLICELIPGKSGTDWPLGNMLKYILRFINLKKEKDLLKLATYCYLVWLKMGFHLNKTHDTDTAKIIQKGRTSPSTVAAAKGVKADEKKSGNNQEHSELLPADAEAQPK